MKENAGHLRVATLNLQIGVGTTRGYLEYAAKFPFYAVRHNPQYVEAAGTMLHALHADVITCTETDGGSWRTAGIDYPILFSRASALGHHHFFEAWHAGGIARHGNSIHSRHPISQPLRYRLPGKGEPRIVGASRIEFESRKMTMLVTHLSLSYKVRREQLRALERIIREQPGQPLILTGDFNIDRLDELDGLLGQVTGCGGDPDASVVEAAEERRSYPREQGVACHKRRGARCAGLRPSSARRHPAAALKDP